MNKITLLIFVATIGAMPLQAAGTSSVPEMRAPTHLEPENPAANLWPSSQYPELYQSTTRLRGIMEPGAPRDDFAVSIKDLSGWYILTVFERSLEAQRFARQNGQKQMAAENNHPQGEAKAETALRSWSHSSKPDAFWLRRCDIGLEPTLALKLIEIWTRMLQDTRENEYDWIVVDGETDHFWLSRDGKALAGHAVGPPEDTNPGMLSAILQALPVYCQSGSQAKLNKIETLIKSTSDLKQIEMLADRLLARLRDAKLP